MHCTNCGKEGANFHMTSIVNGVKEEKHLCSHCASQEDLGKSPFLTSFGEDSLFNNQFLVNALYGGQSLGSTGQASCSKCGMTLGDFNRTGRIGCAHCYATFESQLYPLIKRIQGSTTYEGRLPQRNSENMEIEMMMNQHRRRLIEAVKEENFEEAARIRDEIKVLEEKLNHQ